MTDDHTNVLISVVIPCYDREKYIEAAIDSVLAQEYHPLEIIIVDDGSRDSSIEIIERFGSAVTLIRQENAGAAAARNTGVRNSLGTFLSFLDSDDLWADDKLAKQLDVMTRQPEIDLAFAHAEEFISPELADDVANTIRCREGAMPARLQSTMLIRREAFLKVGFFDETLTIGEGIDWLARANDAGIRSVVLPDVLLRRRLHETNIGRTKKGMRQDYVRALKAALDRRRQQQEPSA